MFPRALLPLAAGLLGLSGSLGATLFLHRAAMRAFDRVLEERLRGAGETAAELIVNTEPTSDQLRVIMKTNGLEGAYVLSPSFDVLMDATGPSGAQANLLRLDMPRAKRAMTGQASIDVAYALGELRIATGYFPIRSADGTIRSVLALEAGHTFGAARKPLQHALWIGVALSLLGALALGVVARQWSRSEDRRRAETDRAARGDALARMAAMIAHEVRNPIGVIRGAAELVSARSGPALGQIDREAIADVLEEVERLRRLTEDFLDLARDPTLLITSVILSGVAADAARGLTRSHPNVNVVLDLPELVIGADPGRLRQVLVNLFSNAAQAGATKIVVRGRASGANAFIQIEDDGHGIDSSIQDRLFDLFATSRPTGTGLGLAVSRRIVERHGGELTLAPGSGSGTTFQIRLPLAAE